MKVLVACEESQRVCTAFRERGHEAYSCDIIECSGGHPEWHIMQDVLPLLNGFCGFDTMDGVHHYIGRRWDLIIAHPPCTYLSNAGACRLYPKKGQLDMERYQKGLEAKEFFLRMLNADCERVCVENPVSSTVFQMPPHTQEIQPWQFGHSVTKKTRLWLRGLPPCALQMWWNRLHRIFPQGRGEKTPRSMDELSGPEKIRYSEAKPSPESQKL